MPVPFRIYGAEMSPFSRKVLAYFRYKSIDHEWIARTSENMVEFHRYTKFPLMPLVVFPDDSPMQDSTPIIEAIEAVHPHPSIHPENASMAFLSALLEEFGDEWVLKLMAHFRWGADQASTVERAMRAKNPRASDSELGLAVGSFSPDRIRQLREIIGSTEENRAILESSYVRLLDTLEAHLARRDYLFGQRPAFADFAVASQLDQCAGDPTAGKIIEARAPYVRSWCERMRAPSLRGPFEGWRCLAPTLLPVLREVVGRHFLPWAHANAFAVTAGRPQFEVDLADGIFHQSTQKYPAKSYSRLAARLGGLSSAEVEELRAIFSEAALDTWFDLIAGRELLPAGPSNSKSRGVRIAGSNIPDVQLRQEPP